MAAHRYEALAMSRQSSRAARRWHTTSPLLQVDDLGACGWPKGEAGRLHQATASHATNSPLLQVDDLGACLGEERETHVVQCWAT